MKIDRLGIASLIVSASTVLFVAAFVANGWGQIRTSGKYDPPPDLIDLIKLSFGAGLAILTIGGIGHARNKIKKMADDEIGGDE